MIILGIALAIGGTVAVLGGILATEVETQYNNWQSSKDRLQNEIEKLNHKIASDLITATFQINIKALKSNRRASIELSNTAYNLYYDARTALKGIKKNIGQTKMEINRFYNLRKNTRDKSLREEYTMEINNLKEYKNALFDTFHTLKSEMEYYYHHLTALNQQTAYLRDKIASCKNRKKN